MEEALNLSSDRLLDDDGVDPMMKSNVKVTRMITEASQPLQQMFNEFKSKSCNSL